MENNQGSKKPVKYDHEKVAKMNIISAYMLGWISFGEALDRMKKVNQETDEQELKKAL